MFLSIIDMQLQELSSRFDKYCKCLSTCLYLIITHFSILIYGFTFSDKFDEVNTQLLTYMAALNPANSFASYNKEKLLKLAKFYLAEFLSVDLIQLSSQLNMFIVDIRHDTRFQGLNNLNDLFIKLVETNKNEHFKLVYLLLKLVLILPVATVSVERVFSAMNLVKTKL